MSNSANSNAFIQFNKSLHYKNVNQSGKKLNYGEKLFKSSM